MAWKLLAYDVLFMPQIVVLLAKLRLVRCQNLLFINGLPFII